ncbi:hypothetical protein BD410DRAFT_716636 [Rickenella mellea]|uniref:U3 small nucleolar RNA-associated protein 6 N-terminal domain-containing protein n=1 Tax=Rickenella mellea TaxID=50990 RepID=A0A4Y7QG38_9AGAM|nr:hypothetical protein BD410DRAFT_716636 [Rickenella mellea]
MERVQFQQEQMLAELKDLARKGLFSQQEVKQIMKKRTAFETALVRRVAKKGDFLRYANYEMTLETLRRKRIDRLQLPPSPPSISDYALVRRQFHIFERALKKFKGDIGLWIQYLQVAKREGARALVGRISARALQLHPNSPALYILAASHELQHLSPTSARTLLQRGIRLNPESVDLWREYVKMELGFVESLRRRWEVLGLDETKDEKGATQNREAAVETDGPSAMDADGADESEEARKEVMDGAIVNAVISNAVKAIPSFPLFNSIHSLIISYPCPPQLRRVLLEHLHSLLRARFSSSLEPDAAKLYATRFLTPELEGDELIDAVKRANEDLLDAVKTGPSGSTGMAKVYAQFVEEWIGKDIEGHMKLYLLTMLQSLCSSSSSPPLLSAHLRLITAANHPSPPSAQKIRKLAKKYTSISPTVADIWLARLDIEHSSGDTEEWKKTWGEARQHISPAAGKEDQEDLVNSVWFYGLDRVPSEELKETYEALLLEAMRNPSMHSFQEKLLNGYIRVLRDGSIRDLMAGTNIKGRQEKDLEHVAQKYLPSAEVWATAFDTFSTTASSTEAASRIDENEETVLRFIYDKWRVKSSSASGEAALAWAAWLVRRRRGAEAADVVSRARSLLDEQERHGFDIRWRRVLDEEEENDNGEDDTHDPARDQ